MIIKTVNLETVCGITSKLPDNTRPEFAFAGKSNVGKSTLINALMNRKSYARTSSTPGKTQTINYYNVNDAFYLVDLPGYGYATAGVKVKQQWGKMIENYLHTSKKLEAVFILAEVPEECPSFNTQILPLIQQYYEREKDLFGEKVLAEARAAWAAEPNERGAAKVAEIMANMPPSCSSSAAARQFVNQISNKIEAIEKWERNYQEREQAFRHDERKATISAARAVAVAYASNQPKYITKVYLW